MKYLFPILILLAGFIGICLFWSVISEVVVFVFGRHWKVVVGVLAIYLVGLEIYERIYLRGKR